MIWTTKYWSVCVCVCFVLTDFSQCHRGAAHRLLQHCIWAERLVCWFAGEVSSASFHVIWLTWIKMALTSKCLVYKCYHCFYCFFFVSWNYNLKNSCFSLANYLGLLPSGGHHLQLQPAAECMGFCSLVQHDQSGHQGLRCHVAYCSLLLEIIARHLFLIHVLMWSLPAGRPVLCQQSCSCLAAVWRDVELAVSLCH